MIDKIELRQKILNVLKKEFFAIDEFVIAKITNDYIDQLNILGNITEDSMLKKLRTSIMDLSSTDSVFARGNPNVPNTSSSFAQSYIEKSIAIYSSFGTGNSQNTMSQIDFNLYGPFESLGSFSPELTRASFYNWGERVSGNDYDTPVIVIGGAWGNTTFGPHSGYALGVVDSFGSGIITASTGFGNLLYIKPATSSITAALFNETGINNDSVTRNLTLTAYSNLIPGINPTAGISISFGGTGQSGNLVFGGASLNTQTNNIKFFSPLTVSNSNITDTLILGLSSTGGASNTQYFAGVGTAQYILSTNISSFNAGDIFYSSGSGHTFLTRLPIGSSNQVLSVSGSTLVWSGSSTTAINVNIANALASSFHPIVFTPSTSSSGSALSANTTLVYNPGTDNLYVSGLFVTSASNAVSYTQGAATITGGLAVSNIHVNNRVTAGVITSGGTATSRVEMYVDSNVNYGLRVFRRTDAVPRIELTNNAFPNSQSEIPGLVFRTSGTGGTCGIGGINSSSGFMGLWTRGASGPEIRLTIQDNVDAQNIIVLGSNTSGTGKTSTLRGTDASGTDIAGNDLIIYAGQPTGSGTVAPIRFRAPNQGSSSSSLNTLLDVVRIGAINNAQSATGLTVTLYVSGGLAVTGNAFIGGTVTAPTFIGNLTGTATTATTANSWTTARTLSITGDGTGSTTLSGAGDTTIYLTLSATQPNITSAANLATIGTITSGVWKGSLIGVTYGGTGSNLGSASGDSNKLIVTGTPSTGFASQLIDGANTGHILVARGNGQAPYFSDTTASAFTFSSGLVSINNAAITQGTISTTPTNDNDLVPKSYVDSVASGLDIHEPVRLTTLSGIAASYVRISGLASSSNDLDGYLISSSFEALSAATGLDTFSGNALTTGQRLLIKDGVTGSYKKGSDPYVAFSTLTTYGAFGASYIANGIYKIIATGGVGSNWIFQRAIDTDDNIELTGGTFTFIQEGGTYADNSFVCTVDTIANGPIGFGSTQITWSAFSTGALVIEQGLTKSAINIALNFNLTGDQVVSGYTFRGFTLGGNRSGATGYSSDASFTVSSHQGANAPVASTLTLNTTGYKLAGGLTSKYLTVSTDLSLDPYSSGGIAFYSGTALSSNSQFVISGAGISINHGTNSSTNSTGALVLNGGLGVTGNAFIGGTVTLSNNTNSISSSSGSLVITGGVGVGGTISVGQRLSVGSNLNSSSTTTGALVNSGGLGMVGNAFIGGTVTMSDTTNSTSSTTGALVISGGVGVGGTVSVGSRVTVGSNVNSISTSSGALVVSGGLGLATNAFIGGTVTLSDTTNSTSTTSGALVVNGGVGISGDVYIASLAGSKLSIMQSSGDEGGELFLNKPVTNTTITTGVTVDIYQNKLRFFEAGGSNRGFYLDITSGGNGVGTNIMGSSSSGTVNNGTATFAAYYASTTNAVNENANLQFTGTGLSVGGNIQATSTTSGSLFVRGGVGIGDTLFVGGMIRLGSNTFTKSYSLGDIALDNGSSTDTPGITYYWGNNSNFGNDVLSDGVGSTRYRIVYNMNETGGREVWTVDQTGQMRLYNTAGSQYIGFRYSGSAITTYSLPANSPQSASGTSVLASSVDGTMRWVGMSAGGSATPGGSDTQIQFNDGGSFGGATGFTYESTNNIVTVSSNALSAVSSVMLRLKQEGQAGNAQPNRYSPAVEMIGRVWTGVAANENHHRYKFEVIPNNGSQTSDLSFKASIDTGTASYYAGDIFTLSVSNGVGIGATDALFTNYFKTSSSQSADKSYTLPLNYPTSGSVGSSVLSSDTSGNLNWVNMSSGGPGGGTVNSGTAGSIAIYSGTTAVSAFPDLSIASSGSGISIFSAMNFRGGNELRLSASGNAAYTALKSATVSTYTLTLPTAAPTSIGNSYLTADTSGNMYWQPAVREQSHRIVFAAGLNPTLGADSAVHMIPFAYQDGFTSVTYRLRRVDCRVETTASGSGAGNTSVFSIEKYAYNAGAGIFTFSTSSTGSTSNIMSIPISIGGAGVAETYWATFAGSHVTSVSGDKLRLNFSTLNAVHTNFSISLIMEAE